MPGIEVRSFNSDGIAAFRKFLADYREGSRAQPPIELLDDRSLLSSPYSGIDIESRSFASRRAAAEYFHMKFNTVPAESLRKDAGLWTWLTLFYFDEICPEVSGTRKIRNDYTYIYMPNESRYFYRHLLFVAWYVRHITPSHNRLFLDTSVDQLDKFTTDVFKRLYITRIPCVFEVLDRLYWEESRSRPRKGVVSPGKVVAGDLMHRFPTRIRQLEKTYDLQSLNADQLINLLGHEFEQFVATPT